ncbi:MAG: ATP synthase F1 subunit delta [Vulcanimicrobiaceae bacterium]
MANEKLARRYAVAIFSLASERDAVERVGRDLRAIADGIAGNEPTKRFFVSPVVAREDKERVAVATFKERVDPIALHALLLVVRKRRERTFGEIVTEYAKLEQRARGTEPLLVTTAEKLGAEDLRALVGRLERLYGRRFEVTHEVDPAAIGGVRVTLGDKRFDGTVAGRLEELSRTLFASN